MAVCWWFLLPNFKANSILLYHNSWFQAIWNKFEQLMIRMVYRMAKKNEWLTIFLNLLCFESKTFNRTQWWGYRDSFAMGKSRLKGTWRCNSFWAGFLHRKRALHRKGEKKYLHRFKEIIFSKKNRPKRVIVFSLIEHKMFASLHNMSKTEF